MSQYELSKDTSDVVEAAAAIRGGSPARVVAPPHTRTAGVLLAALLNRAAKTVDAGLILCRAGFGEQALMLSRSVFEDMVDVHWVSIDVGAAVERWNDAGLEARGLRDARIRPYSEEFDLPGPLEPPLPPELAERQARLLKRHHYGSWTTLSMRKRLSFIEHLFSGSDLERGMFELVKNLGEGMASDLVHASPLAIYSGIDLESKRPGVTFKSWPAEQFVASASLMLGYSFAQLLGQVADELEIPGVEERAAAYRHLLEVVNRK